MTQRRSNWNLFREVCIFIIIWEEAKKNCIQLDVTIAKLYRVIKRNIWRVSIFTKQREEKKRLTDLKSWRWKSWLSIWKGQKAKQELTNNITGRLPSQTSSNYIHICAYHMSNQQARNILMLHTIIQEILPISKFKFALVSQLRQGRSRLR